MRKLYIVVILLCICTFVANAQYGRSIEIDELVDMVFDDGSCRVMSNHSISMSLVLGLEYSYEDAISDRSSLIFRAGIPNHNVWAAYHDASGYHYSGYYDTAIGISFEPRYYLDLAKRSRRGKSTFMNTGNYVSVPVGLTMNSSERLGIKATPVFGMRRVVASGWMFEWNLGLGLAFQEYEGVYVCPNFLLRAGYCF